MEKKRRTEEEIKEAIFSVYSCYKNETSSDRRQVYVGQLCDLIFRWCSDFLIKEANEMGCEIVMAVQRVVEKKEKNESAFFKYLSTALYTAKKEYLRREVNGPVRIPRKYNAIKREISRRFVPLYANDMEIASIYQKDEYFSKIDVSQYTKLIQEAYKSVMTNKQGRTRECYRALFTVHCIEKAVDFEGLFPILDSEILNKYLKSGKKPTQSEVYQKYHPEVKKTSSDARSSSMIKEFLDCLKAAIKEKNPEIFYQNH